MPSDPAAAQAFCLVLTATATSAQAEELARAVVQARLAACVQVQAIRSFYVWQGQSCEEPECLLLMKTRTACYPALEAFIRERHAYEVPEIVCLPISAGAPAYLDWVAQQTGAAAG